ncbi:hypothetical protein Neut_2231 [Nitrosomonas eutropha C91]|uniref:Uncharacterized protein n=1 Tax=Nitrosomonas eutropha (strain DSM 101675 / C91 / Nm57) TaxID=335283 RepID=Q0ADY3_NITEC|nr:hypothetical protein Neut_2231 [Nitrosomonas eutropha C91]
MGVSVYKWAQAEDPNVSIPLKSGHGCFFAATVKHAHEISLNPFEIRAWVFPCNQEELEDFLTVSIPLKSGHGCFHTRTPIPNQVKVSIPLKSGHGCFGK